MQNAIARVLKSKIESKSAVVGIVGLGYVGLPLVDAFIRGGISAIGFDVDKRKVDALNQGQSYIAHIPPSKIQKWLSDGMFKSTADMLRLNEADAILICVPTPLNDTRDPDLSFVTGTTQSIARVLRKGQLIVLESTTYPGTTRDVMLPLLSQSGLVVGQDYFLSYSPEREDPGNPTYSANSIPKVVGGYDDTCLELAVALYNQAVTKTIPVKTLEIAEACKILENTYRGVNIAMVNELKMLFDRMGIDIWEVIDAAKTKPFGFQAFYPGPGLGGHCIPIDPFYLTWLARKFEMPTKFIELAGEINTSMPHYVINRLADALNLAGKPIRGSRICVLGVAYKKDIDDPRESPSFKLMELLQSRGAVLSYSDPHIPHLPAMRHYDVPRLSSQELTPSFLASLDCALIATDHSIFDYTAIVEHAPLVIDTRNATRAVESGRNKIVKA
jgi:UDP-N-acetyl-D-glucosamine dehydrogenase